MVLGSKVVRFSLVFISVSWFDIILWCRKCMFFFFTFWFVLLIRIILIFWMSKDITKFSLQLAALQGKAGIIILFIFALIYCLCVYKLFLFLVNKESTVIDWFFFYVIFTVLHFIFCWYILRFFFSIYIYMYLCRFFFYFFILCLICGFVWFNYCCFKHSVHFWHFLRILLQTNTMLFYLD